MPQPTLNGSTYYLRVRVPNDIAEKAHGMTAAVPVGDRIYHVAVTSHVKASLRTKDRTEAKRRFTAALEALEDLWQTLRNDVVRLSNKQVVALAGEVRRDFIQLFDEDPGAVAKWARVAGLDERARQGELNSLAVGTEATRELDLEQRFGPLSGVALRRRGLVVDDQSRRRLIRAVANAMVDVPVVNAMKASGDYSDSGETNRFPAFQGPNRSQTKSPVKAAGPKFQSVIEEKARQRAEGTNAKPMPSSTRSKYELLAQEFAKFRGSDQVHTVTAREAEDWKQAMLREGKLSNRSIAQRIQNLKTLVEWARKQSLGEVFPDRNPIELVEGPAYTQASGMERSIKMDEARQILRAARKQTKPELRWLPWMCAYSGARINELSPLTPEDFFQYEGLWFYRFISAGRRSLKNIQSHRVVPVHPDLLQEGLIDMVTQARASKLERLFLVRSGDNVSKFVRYDLGIDRKLLAPSHGWRHLFEDLAMSAGMSDSAKNYVTGRSQGRSSEGYGKSEVMLPGLYRELAKIPTLLPAD